MLRVRTFCLKFEVDADVPDNDFQGWFKSNFERSRDALKAIFDRYPGIRQASYQTNFAPVAQGKGRFTLIYTLVDIISFTFK